MMLEMARKDLKALEGMLDKETFDDEIFGFHAQQSVEKALKSWLSIIGAGYPKIHDLEELFSLLEDNGITVSEQLKELSLLTTFSVQFRYEAFIDIEELLDRQALIGTVQTLFNKVGAILEEENRLA